MEKKKLILIVVAVLVVVAIVAGILFFGKTNIEQKESLDGSTSKVSKLYYELSEKQEYSFTTKIDDENEVYYAKKNDKAYIKTINDGETNEEIVRDGNTYLLDEENKEYNVYSNNETELEKVILQLEVAKDGQYVEGKEKINGKEYKFEEYDGVEEFLLNDIITNGKEVKTRFYFDGDKLVYIKTLVANEQELLKVDFSYSVEDKLFEIPAEYSEVS